MKIACLAWGSLVWDPRTLPHAGAFRLEGPSLPVEFSRVALDGRVTLVIDPDAEPIPTYRVALSVDSLPEAIAALGERERIPQSRWSDHVGVCVRREVGFERRGETPAAVADVIERWLARQALDAVLWTALPARGPDGTLDVPDVETLLAHLAALDGEAWRRAEEYVRRTPPPIRTRRRRRFEAELGWTPVEAPPIGSEEPVGEAR